MRSTTPLSPDTESLLKGLPVPIFSSCDMSIRERQAQGPPWLRGGALTFLQAKGVRVRRCPGRVRIHGQRQTHGGAQPRLCLGTHGLVVHGYDERVEHLWERFVLDIATPDVVRGDVPIERTARLA